MSWHRTSFCERCVRHEHGDVGHLVVVRPVRCWHLVMLMMSSLWCCAARVHLDLPTGYVASLGGVERSLLLLRSICPSASATDKRVCKFLVAVHSDNITATSPHDKDVAMPFSTRKMRGCLHDVNPSEQERLHLERQPAFGFARDTHHDIVEGFWVLQLPRGALCDMAPPLSPPN